MKAKPVEIETELLTSTSSVVTSSFTVVSFSLELEVDSEKSKGINSYGQHKTNT